jgi:2-polyprenyl-3-methyl-5-hydroxy-6-metoxy-1,4-benzoquinol methylase
MSEATVTAAPPDVHERALASRGISTSPVYAMVRRILIARGVRGGILLDVGCGTGALQPVVADCVGEYIGADVVRYPEYPDSLAFHLVNLDTQQVELPPAAMDVVVSAETIEHLENPRALWRELTRLARPGGLVIVTTPNNLSLLSKACLVLKNQFVMFQDRDYPAHITPIVEMDLVRMARECGLTDIAVHYSGRGRMPGTPWHWPAWLGLRGRAFSDNVAIVARKT